MERDPHVTGADADRAVSRFAAATSLFAAIETGELDAVRRLLDRHPDLVDAEEDWDDATARAAGLQPARHASPLIRAVGRGRVEVVELLLERGAAVDRTCGCAGGESALWAATVAGSGELVRLLLDHGADPTRAAFSGTTPLHVAAIRGYDHLTTMLLAAGARPDVTDEDGRTADDWARGRATADVPLRRDREVVVAAEAGTPLETGIRAIDLFAPLSYGGLVSWLAPAGVGSLVLLIEVLHRLTLLEGLDANVIGFEHGGVTAGEIGHAVAELAPARKPGVHLVPAGEAVARRREAFADAVGAVAGSAGPHRRAPMTVVVRRPGHDADIEACLPGLLAASSLVILLGAEETTDPSTLQATTAVVLDVRRAKARLFPAVDPSRSYGRCEDVAHRRLATAAKELLATYDPVDPELRLEPSADPAATTAQRLHRYLAQPFHTTEPFTGKPGESTARLDLLHDVEAILAGDSRMA